MGISLAGSILREFSVRVERGSEVLTNSVSRTISEQETRKIVLRFRRRCRAPRLASVRFARAENSGATRRDSLPTPCRVRRGSPTAGSILNCRVRAGFPSTRETEGCSAIHTQTHAPTYGYKSARLRTAHDPDRKQSAGADREFGSCCARTGKLSTRWR